MMNLKGEFMTNNPSKTTTSTAVPETPPSMVKKIGNITYRVEDKIKRMLQNEVRQMMESE